MNGLWRGVDSSEGVCQGTLVISAVRGGEDARDDAKIATENEYSGRAANLDPEEFKLSG